MPLYSWLGLAILALSEAGMIARVEPFWTWHTAIAWTGYILLIDGIISRQRGSSWLTTDRREFLFLAVVSIPLWVIFEGYNLLIRNWHYINLPENLIVRYLGYAWAFATISPAIFLTAELVAVMRATMVHGPSSMVHGRSKVPGQSNDQSKVNRPPHSPTVGHRPTLDNGPWTMDDVSLAAGAAMLMWPLIWPSPYLAAPVFLGFIFLLDPLNARAGDESLIRDLRSGRPDRLINLLTAGFICGGLWEFWNFWARAKWIYTVPIVGHIKIFEMPVLGYFGFPPFALECFTMYVFTRRLLWRRPGRPVAL